MNIGVRTQKKALMKGIEERYEHAKDLRFALITELDMLSRLSIKAFDDLEQAIELGDETRIWYSIYMMLYTHEHIRELLEEIKKLSEEDPMMMDELSTLLDYDSGLSTEKNALREHFGKGIEEWILGTDSERTIENYIFVKESLPSMHAKGMLRHFDPETYEFIFRDNVYDLKNEHEKIKKIKEEIDRIYIKNF